MVADSALYTASNIFKMATLRWLCRVPLTLKQARQLIEQLSDKDFVESTIPGYRWAAQTSNYGGVHQRWLVVESETRRASDLRKLEKNIEKAHQEAKKNLRKLAAQEFACQPDALAAATRLSKELKYHNLTQIQIVQVLPESEANSSNSAESSQQVCRACCEKRKPLAIKRLSGIESCSTPRQSGKIRQNPCTSTRENVPES